MRLPGTLAAIGVPSFDKVCKTEIEDLDPLDLPLQQGLSLSSVVADQPFSVVLLSKSVDSDTVVIKAGIFYAGVIAGCSCADDPTPIDEQTEYCEIEVLLDRKTAEARIRLLPAGD